MGYIVGRLFRLLQNAVNGNEDAYRTNARPAGESGLVGWRLVASISAVGLIASMARNMMPRDDMLDVDDWSGDKLLSELA